MSPGYTTGNTVTLSHCHTVTLSYCPVPAPGRLVSPSQPRLNIRKTPNRITRRLAQFRDHSITRDTNHLMLALTSTEMKVVRGALGGIRYQTISLFLPGHGSLSSLASLGHGSAPFISEEKTKFEIQKLQQELQEEHQKCKRLQSQLSTNVSGETKSEPIQSNFYIHCPGACCLRLRAFPGQHDIQTVPVDCDCRGKGQCLVW